MSMAATIATVLCAVGFALTPHASAQVFLPGTQPREGGIKLSKVGLCGTCHSRTPNGDADPFFSWQGGMMAQAARDPVFRAALAIANQDIPGVGEYCIRCHAPAGWFEGRSSSPDGSALTKHDRQGVSCDVCHRLVDPASAEGRQMAEEVPPGYGNGMMVADPRKVARGPYDDSPPVKSHLALKSDFQHAGQLCGTCHDVSNPLAADDVRTQQPYAYGAIERTFSEWLLSDYAGKADGKTCQACHYPAVAGGGKAARHASAKHRDYFVEHGPVGGSTWVQDAVVKLWPDARLNRAALERAQEKARRLLETAARLELSFPAASKMSLRVVNLTGHKLPTGYPEGRRMWVNVRFLDSNDKLLQEIGRYETVERDLAGKAVNVNTLVDPQRTRVYQCLPGMSPEQAAKHGQEPGKSFHFVLNDEITFDNRIPPKGFDNSKFREHNCQPIGATYADGQHWSDVPFDLPDGCAKVAVRLLYQSVSWEYIKFLAEENRTDDWGGKLFAVWHETGQCPPTVMAAVERQVP